MRVRAAVLGLCFAVASIVAWVFIPSFFRTEESATLVAEKILREELSRVGVRADAFAFVDAKKSGLDWIVTWHSKSDPFAQVGVTITPFEADVWGRPLVPSCISDRVRTVVVFGEVC
jgi:hypothetical protein